MKTAFLPKLVNGQTGDPALFVDLLREKRALLFDCGLLNHLSPSEIIRVSDVFVSHTHIDHFIGFEHLLRLHLGRGHLVRVFGPSGITGCVRGKLSGYTWNLVRHQRLVFEVHEWSSAGTQVTEFHCRRRFKQSATRDVKMGNTIWRDDFLEVKTAALDHRIPSLAFSVTERDFYNVDPVKLEASGHKPGAWLNELKKWVRAGRLAGGTVEIDEQPCECAPLADDLLIHTPGRKLGYIADSKGSPANVQAAVELVRGVDLLYCEGAFLHEDLKRANTTYHLTARQAGEIARQAGVRRLVLFHFSPKYEGRYGELVQEAATAFGKDSVLVDEGQQELSQEVGG